MRHRAALRVLVGVGAVAFVALVARQSVAAPPVVALATDESVAAGGHPIAAVGSGEPSGIGVCAAGPTLGAPDAPPPGAVEIAAGDDPARIVATAPAPATFWFAPGTHVVDHAIEARSGDTYLGAPGAQLVGAEGNAIAFEGRAHDVTLAHLDLADFRASDPDGARPVNTAAVNRSVGDRWSVEASSFTGLDGAALFLGSGSVVRDSCFDSNGQYGVSVPSRRSGGEAVAISDVVISGNEFVNNNPDDFESEGGCRGCTGAMKLWMPHGATIRGNHIHDNHGVGVWVDTNGVDVVVEDNLIEDNDRSGVFIETSYNSRVLGNTFIGNAVVAGRSRGAGATFPDAAVYISESGGSEGLGELPGRVDVSGNFFVDNWNGVTLWENANRFCSSEENTSVGYCPLDGPDPDTCAAMGTGDAVALLDRCRWRTRGVGVTDNLFRTTEGFDCPAPTCGRNAIIASTLDRVVRTVDRSGRVRAVAVTVDPATIQHRIVAESDNTFADNTYEGEWWFSLGTADSRLDGAAWADAGFDD